jgi:hypothetical protein
VHHPRAVLDDVINFVVSDSYARFPSVMSRVTTRGWTTTVLVADFDSRFVVSPVASSSLSALGGFRVVGGSRQATRTSDKSIFRRCRLVRLCGFFVIRINAGPAVG